MHAAMLTGLLLTASLANRGVETLDADSSLADAQPFDQLVLNDEQRSVLNVFPIDLPNRRLPTPRPTGSLEIRLLNRPGQVFEVAWE
jgi:hypothetical protein